MKPLLTILLCCFCLVTMAQAAPAYRTHEHSVGIRDAQTVTVHKISVVEGIEDVKEVEGYDQVVILDTFTYRHFSGSTFHALTEHPSRTLRNNVPLYIAVRRILL